MEKASAIGGNDDDGDSHDDNGDQTAQYARRYWVSWGTVLTVTSRSAMM